LGAAAQTTAEACGGTARQRAAISSRC
jgi:hypothetical protein